MPCPGVNGQGIAPRGPGRREGTAPRQVWPLRGAPRARPAGAHAVTVGAVQRRAQSALYGRNGAGWAPAEEGVGAGRVSACSSSNRRPGGGGGAAPPRAAQPTRTPLPHLLPAGGISGRALIEAVVLEGKVDRKAGARVGGGGVRGEFGRVNECEGDSRRSLTTFYFCFVGGGGGGGSPRARPRTTRARATTLVARASSPHRMREGTPTSAATSPSSEEAGGDSGGGGGGGGGRGLSARARPGRRGRGQACRRPAWVFGIKVGRREGDGAGGRGARARAERHVGD